MAKSHSNSRTSVVPAAAKMTALLREDSSNSTMISTIQGMMTGEGREESRMPSRGIRRPTAIRRDNRA